MLNILCTVVSSALETKIGELNAVIKEQEKQAALRRHEASVAEQKVNDVSYSKTLALNLSFSYSEKR